MTASLQLQPVRITLIPQSNRIEDGGPLVLGAAPIRRCRPRSALKPRPLTLPVAPRVPPDKPKVCEEPGPLPLPLRQQEQFSRPGAPSISTCAPPTFAGSARHRSRDFAAAIRLPALVHPTLLSQGGARSLDVYAGYSPGLARTTRRMSTSAIDKRSPSTTARSIEPRSPTPGVAPERSSRPDACCSFRCLVRPRNG